MLHSYGTISLTRRNNNHFLGNWRISRYWFVVYPARQLGTHIAHILPLVSAISIFHTRATQIGQVFRLVIVIGTVCKRHLRKQRFRTSAFHCSAMWISMRTMFRAHHTCREMFTYVCIRVTGMHVAQKIRVSVAQWQWKCTRSIWSYLGFSHLFFEAQVLCAVDCMRMRIAHPRKKKKKKPKQEP